MSVAPAILLAGKRSVIVPSPVATDPGPAARRTTALERGVMRGATSDWTRGKAVWGTDASKVWCSQTGR